MKKVRKDLTRLLTESVYAIGADPARVLGVEDRRLPAYLDVSTNA